MDHDRIAKALARVASATNRIESCGQVAGNRRVQEDITARHTALRAEADAVLGDLNALIAELEK